jgi:DNA-binding MarR family transcriptional regulator
MSMSFFYATNIIYSHDNCLLFRTAAGLVLHISSNMEIGSELNQRNFRNEYHKATVNLVFTNGWLADKLKGFFEPYDLTQQQFNILRILRGNKAPLSTLQIRERMIDRMSDSSRIVERMIRKGLVEKNINKADKRLVDVAITRKGNELLSEIDTRQAQLDNIVANITVQQAKTLNYILDKLRGWDNEQIVLENRQAELTTL